MTEVTATQIQATLKNLTVAMLAREYRVMTMQASFAADAQCCVQISWDDNLDDKHGYKYLYADTMQKALIDAAEFVSHMPQAADRAQKVFATALSAAIETGRKTGIDVTYLNPLTAMMKKLSGNALEYQPDPAAPVVVPNSSVNLYGDAPVVDFGALDAVGLAPQVIDEQTTEDESNAFSIR